MSYPKVVEQESWTVRELREWLLQYPEDAEVWMATGWGLSSPVTEIWPLNGGKDVMLDNSKVWQK